MRVIVVPSAHEVSPKVRGSPFPSLPYSLPCPSPPLPHHSLLRLTDSTNRREPICFALFFSFFGCYLIFASHFHFAYCFFSLPLRASSLSSPCRSLHPVAIFALSLSSPSLSIVFPRLAIGAHLPVVPAVNCLGFKAGQAKMLHLLLSNLICGLGVFPWSFVPMIYFFCHISFSLSVFVGLFFAYLFIVFRSIASEPCALGQRSC